MTNSSPTPNDAATRLHDAEAELASIKEQVKGPTTPEVRRALADRLNRLQEEIQQLRSSLAGMKRAH